MRDVCMGVERSIYDFHLGRSRRIDVGIIPESVQLSEHGDLRVCLGPPTILRFPHEQVGCPHPRDLFGAPNSRYGGHENGVFSVHCSSDRIEN
jgi:hypothetical protein